MKNNITQFGFKQKFSIWLKSSYGMWGRRIGIWVFFVVFIRFLYFENFYADRETVLNTLTSSLVLQTLLLYYVFAYYIFPKTLYQSKWSYLLFWFFVWHLVIYESNYLLFLCLSKIDHGSRLDRDWKRLYDAGFLGFISNGWASFWSFFYSFPFAIMGLTIRAINDIINLRTKNFILEKDKLNLELDFLKSQVNPHFLFNTLNSVYSRIFDVDEDAADLVLRLSELMRYNLYETNFSSVTLDKELAYIQNYLNLERNRLANLPIEISYQ